MPDIGRLHFEAIVTVAERFPINILQSLTGIIQRSSPDILPLIVMNRKGEEVARSGRTKALAPVLYGPRVLTEVMMKERKTKEPQRNESGMYQLNIPLPYVAGDRRITLVATLVDMYKMGGAFVLSF